jgi:hypothetical protein
MFNNKVTCLNHLKTHSEILSTVGKAARQRNGQRERKSGVQRLQPLARGLGTAAESPKKMAELLPIQPAQICKAGQLLSDASSFPVVTSCERNSMIPGPIQLTETRDPGLNPACSSHFPMMRIFGFMTPFQRSPSASIFNVRFNEFIGSSPVKLLGGLPENMSHSGGAGRKRCWP